MVECRNLDFSPKLMHDRMAKAQASFGGAMLKRILAFALFVLGVRRSRIAEALDMPAGTVRSVLRRVFNTRLDGFVDQRAKTDIVRQQTPEAPQALTLHIAGTAPDLEISGGMLKLPVENTVQRKVVLLSLIGEGMLSFEQVAEVLDLSTSHVRRLHRQLFADDVEGIIDKRRGQQQDYRVDAGTKGQMITEFVLELVERGRVSSGAVARRLEAAGTPVAERTIRSHLSALGLNEIRGTLASALSSAKKNSGH